MIEKLLDYLYATDKAPSIPKDDVFSSILLREKIGGTIIPSGLSVPHSRHNDFDGFIVVLGTPGAQIFQDGFEIRLMALMLSSPGGGPYYLPTVSSLTRLSMDKDFFSSLCGAKTPEDLLDMIRGRDLVLM